MTNTPHAGGYETLAREFVLSFADDELCVGQNHSWWIAVGPFLEEDLAFISIAQDELGHARALYELLEPGSADTLAYGRAPADYRSSPLAERPCHDWSEALVRHYLYDVAEQIRWEALVSSSWPELGAIARRAIVEERFHTGHAVPLMRRLLSVESSRPRILGSIDAMAKLGRSLFGAVSGADELVNDGIVGLALAAQEALWRAAVDEIVAPHDIDWALDTPTPRRGAERSGAFAALHHEMVEVLEIDPAAHW
ncbi:MAG: ring-1,2-phenylacetyl-CoA epoxidase subunit PaaC [Candidatus Poriferisodalaceae bacterium]|jgi:ring-1,2-phenylacetyl-CoA epoxidase subunit PaaC